MTKSSSKYENTILYLANQLGGSVDGKKKLAKLLYYIDFDRFEYKESMQTVTGDKYKAWKMGPVPNSYMQVVEELVNSGAIERVQVGGAPGYRPTDTFRAKKQADLSVFSKEDLEIINHVIRKYGGLNGTQLQNLTHDEAPYVATEPDEEIAYELAFYRETDFSDVVANT